MINPVYQATALPVEMNRSSWQSRGLVGWWPTLNQSGTQLLLDPAKRNNGTLSGPTRSHTRYGPFLNYTKASSHYVDLGTPAELNVSGNITMAAWIVVASFPTASEFNNILSDAYVGGGPTISYFFDIKNEGGLYDLRVGSYDGSSYLVTFDVTSVISTNTIYHVCGLYDGANWVLYLDGAQRATSAQPSGALGAVSESVWIGGSKNLGRHWDGQIGDVRIYNRGLTAGEVAALYDPQTRWDLYKKPRRIYAKAPAAAPAQTEGPLVKGRLIRGGSLSGALVR